MAKENFERIKELALPGQNVIHIKDIDGIYNGHKECALQSSTKHFFVIDGDGWVDMETAEMILAENC